MRRILLTVFAGLLLSVPLRGQSAAARPMAMGQSDPVTVVNITGTVAPVRAGDPPLPFEVLQQLERDPFLTLMHTEARVQTGPALLLTYAFPGVEAYRTWAATPQTLLEQLRQRVSQFELTVSLVRGAAGTVMPTGS